MVRFLIYLLVYTMLKLPNTLKMEFVTYIITVTYWILSCSYGLASLIKKSDQNNVIDDYTKDMEIVLLTFIIALASII
jgi:hypothetical protein